ncbi:MAG: hypothetical protein V3W37_09165 [Candidatus Binatia bacterium]
MSVQKWNKTVAALKVLKDKGASKGLLKTLRNRLRGLYPTLKEDDIGEPGFEDLVFEELFGGKAYEGPVSKRVHMEDHLPDPDPNQDAIPFPTNTQEILSRVRDMQSSINVIQSIVQDAMLSGWSSGGKRKTKPKVKSKASKPKKRSRSTPKKSPKKRRAKPSR